MNILDTCKCASVQEVANAEVKQWQNTLLS